MDELTDKIEDDHFLTPEELKEMRAIIQHSFQQAKQKGMEPNEIKKEADPQKTTPPAE